MAWIGAVVGGLASMYGAQQQNRSQRGAGQVDVQHFVNPYPGSEVYRNAGAAAAYNQMFGPGSQFNTTPPAGAPGGQRITPGTLGLPPGGAGAGSDPTGPAGPGGNEKVPAGFRVNKKGKTVKVKGGGGAGGAAKPAGFQGQSPETASAIGNAMRVAGTMETSPVVTSAQNFSAATLGGGQDPNAYRAETADMIRGIDDSDYRRYLDALFEADTGLGTGSGGGAPAPRGGNVRFLPSGTSAAKAAIAAGGGNLPQKSGPIGSDKFLKDILEGGDTPFAQAMRDRIRRQAEEGFNEQLRQRRLEASGAGMFGGTGHLADEQFALGKFGSGLADAFAAQDYDTYRQALGLATGFDVSSLDRAAQERIAAENSATARAGIGASAGAAEQEIASRERTARLNALGEAIGMGAQRQQFGISAMGSLGEGMSADQRAALGLAGDTNALGQAGWLNAGGLSLGSDQARNAWQSSQNALRGQLAGVGLGRQQLAFDRERYFREAPMRDIAQYQSIISGTYDPYASTWDTGVDRRNQSPSYSNVALQGLAGAAAGYQLGGDIRNTYVGGGGGASAAGSYDPYRPPQYSGGGW